MVIRALLIAFAILVASVIAVSGQDWTVQIEGIERSVPRLEMLEAGQGTPGTCSGVFINAEAGYVLTAAHCVEPDAPGAKVDVTVNNRDAMVARSNRILDLAVVRVSPLKEDVTLMLAEKSPPAGTPIAVIGYGFGNKRIFPQFGHIALPLDDATTSLLNVDVLFGDSGGAIIDRQGRLVGLTSAILHRGPAHIGIAVPIEVVREYVTPYLPVK